MGWDTSHIARLQAGETVRFRPRGHSMTPKIRSGQLVEAAPLPPDDPAVGDVVLCKVGGAHYLHHVSALQGDLVQIANARGHVNGRTPRTQVFGRLQAPLD